MSAAASGRPGGACLQLRLQAVRAAASRALGRFHAQLPWLSADNRQQICGGRHAVGGTQPPPPAQPPWPAHARWRGSPPPARDRSRTQTWFKTAAGGEGRPQAAGRVSTRPAPRRHRRRHRQGARPAPCGAGPASVPSGPMAPWTACWRRGRPGWATPGPSPRERTSGQAPPPASAPDDSDAPMQYARAMKGGMRARPAGMECHRAPGSGSSGRLRRGSRAAHPIIGASVARSVLPASSSPTASRPQAQSNTSRQLGSYNAAAAAAMTLWTLLQVRGGLPCAAAAPRPPPPPPPLGLTAPCPHV